MKPQQTGGERKIKAEVMDDGWTQQRRDSSSQEVKSVSSQFSPRGCSTRELHSIHRAEDGRASDTRQHGGGGVHRPDRREDALSVNSLRHTKKAVKGLRWGYKEEARGRLNAGEE